MGNGGAGASNSGDAAGNNGQNSVFGSPGDPGLGQGGLTAKGGGDGGRTMVMAGGSGGGGANGGSGAAGATAQQPTQPGNSGAYGFGTAGGSTAPQMGRRCWWWRRWRWFCWCSRTICRWST